ncbi:SGNH/GDSL hydrolase family protein [Erythrobacter litoralis]|uniref:SGNH hydrolase-type esterase domain-containing protein n=1 Tax=Erythrobacter litoralis (strain HTCC2594) TaxID=314225 RepID=Q2N704_ERYLH|nr:SGNH/GDSL hydrolase family protein [Erythrobacter litoralis]ABC64537.1 hypothetical protein ELI_12225 [Erythrobacter litoralis HTCC2594]
MFALHAPRELPRPRIRPAEAAILPELANPAPVLSTSASPTLPRYWPTSSGTQFNPVASAPQGGVFTFTRGLPGSETASISFSDRRVRTTSNSGPRSSLGQQWSFMHHGARLELQIRNNTHGFFIRVDNRFVSLTPYETSGHVMVMVDFGTSAVRRIDIISWGLAFAGVYTDPTDCLFAAELRGPRAIVLGDSFTSPEPDNWVSWFSHAMGWDDVWASGAGGTGFVADAQGTGYSIPDRVMSDVVPFAPDLVFLHAGINDMSRDPSEVEAAAARTVKLIRENVPGVVVAGGVDTAFGVESWSAHNLDVKDAVRSGMESEGAGWISPFELPFDFGGNPIGHQATLYASIVAGQAGNDGTPTSVTHPNGFVCNTSVSNPAVNLRVGSVVEIGTDATRERVAITCTGYHHARVAYGFDGAMQYDHAPGEPVREVAPCFVTGQGSTAAPSGWGSADRYVGADSFHYSPEGHMALGIVNASLLRHHLRGRALI